MNNPKNPTVLVKPSEVFTPEELQTLSVCYSEEEPRGKILKERHGYTHYHIEGVDNGPSAKGLVVLLHGIGTSHHEFFVDFAKVHLEAGYSVLAYDYYGHGYSKYDGDMFINYDLNMLVDQLEDVLSFVENETGETCIALFGHSTGGLVCAGANERWSKGTTRPVVPKLIMAAPAFYAKKPFMARVADKIPGLLTSVMKKISASRVIIGDSYMEAGEVAFARDPSTGKVLYSVQEQKKTDLDNVLFGKVKGKKKHPYLEGGILGLNCHTLRGDLLEGHRNMLVKMLKKDGDEKSKTLWIWGNLDRTVPYKENLQEVQGWEKEFDNFSLQVLDRIGHEMIYENSEMVAKSTVNFLNN